MHDNAGGRERLLRRAETVLRPALAILLECAYEGERVPAAARYLEGIIKRFFDCADRGEPLGGDDYEPFEMYFPKNGNTLDTVAVGLLSQETLSLEKQLKSDALPGDDDFAELVAENALALNIAPLAPIVLGVGVSDTPEESRLLARLGLFRSPDKHSPDSETAACERRILARLNRRGPGAGGFGGSHTAIAVGIEHTARGYITLLPGGALTRFAKAELL